MTTTLQTWRWRAAVAVVAASVIAGTGLMAQAAPIVFQAGGTSSPASIQATVDAFRTALGDPNNGNAAGPLASGRREINWDGGGSTATTAPVTPFTTFLNTRGGQFTTPGTGLSQATPDGLATLLPEPLSLGLLPHAASDTLARVAATSAIPRTGRKRFSFQGPGRPPGHRHDTLDPA